MNSLSVLYDQECALCRSCCAWLGRQPAFIKLHFIALQSPQIEGRFPGIEKLNPREQLVVISDEGDIYQGQHAWIMCLYALRDYREWSLRLAHPALLPLARHVCELVSRNRFLLSRFFLKVPVEELRQKITATSPLVCDTERGTCR